MGLIEWQKTLESKLRKEFPDYNFNADAARFANKLLVKVCPAINPIAEEWLTFSTPIEDDLIIEHIRALIANQPEPLPFDDIVHYNLVERRGGQIVQSISIPDYKNRGIE